MFGGGVVAARRPGGEQVQEQGCGVRVGVDISRLDALPQLLDVEIGIVQAGAVVQVRFQLAPVMRMTYYVYGQRMAVRQQAQAVQVLLGARRFGGNRIAEREVAAHSG